MSEQFNGWTNWDTWNASLWLNNTESVYFYFAESVECLQGNVPELADLLESELPEFTLGDGYDPKKVNWIEVAEDFIE